jgi:hypothetical protein
MVLRVKGALHVYETCRGFGISRAHSVWLAIKYAFAGKTGKHRINWRRHT